MLFWLLAEFFGQSLDLGAAFVAEGRENLDVIFGIGQILAVFQHFQQAPLYCLQNQGN